MHDSGWPYGTGISRSTNKICRHMIYPKIANTSKGFLLII